MGNIRFLSTIPSMAERTVGNIEVPHSVTLDHFWESVATGKWVPLSREKAEELVKRNYFSHRSIVSFGEEEMAKLKAHITENLLTGANSGTLKLLAISELVLLNAATEITKIDRRYADFWLKEGKIIFLAEDAAVEAKKRGLPILTIEEKIKILSDPQTWVKGYVAIPNLTSPITHGIRPFFKGPKTDSYGYSQNELKEILRKVHSDTQKESLKILDIGGGNGRAMWELKQEFRDLNVINLTIDEEPGMFPVTHLLCPAERMPNHLFENVDLAFSNTAWRYFLYPDLALRNLLAALSVGGQAAISFAWDRCPLPENEIEERVRGTISSLKKLRQAGVINYDLVQSSIWNLPAGYLKIEKRKHLPNI